MYALARALLFALDAEAAHRLTLAGLRAAHRLGLLRLLAAAQPAQPVELMGLSFANRIGLAAGFDKNAACVDAMGALGFGFVEVGTLTPKAQQGNPKPRVFRLPKARARHQSHGLSRMRAWPPPSRACAGAATRVCAA